MEFNRKLDKILLKKKKTLFKGTLIHALNKRFKAMLTWEKNILKKL